VSSSATPATPWTRSSFSASQVLPSRFFGGGGGKNRISPWLVVGGGWVISNASDALGKIRFLSLTGAQGHGGGVCVAVDTVIANQVYAEGHQLQAEIEGSWP
jgi:hypothetical protein